MRRLITSLLIIYLTFSQVAQAYSQAWLPHRPAQHRIERTDSSLTHQGSTLQGKSVKINSGGDLILQAADVKAGDGGITLDAGNDIKLLVAADQHSHTHTERFQTDGHTFRADGSLNDTDVRRMKKKFETQEVKMVEVNRLSIRYYLASLR